MRLLLYNIRYGIGARPTFQMPLPGVGYLSADKTQLNKLIEFIRGSSSDIVGLIEVDTGSVRSGGLNQVQKISQALGYDSSYQVKYGDASINKLLPIIRMQGNALLASSEIHNERFHYFDAGIKKLVIELELEDCAVFLVHLSLKYRHRQVQMRHLYDLVKASDKPVIVAGDFNTLWGDDEIFLFMKATGLQSANEQNLPSYPSQAPRREFDYILYGSDIRMNNFEIPNVTLSDHLPLICDFEVV
jgi:endonuclease/exonuclease/phosphatase family metal-dependent hydrolase